MACCRGWGSAIKADIDAKRDGVGVGWMGDRGRGGLKGREEGWGEMNGRVLMGGVGMMGLWYGGFYFSAVVILYREEEVVKCRRWVWTCGCGCGYSRPA